MVAFEIVPAVVCAESAVIAAMFVGTTTVHDDVRPMVDAISALREEKAEPPLPPDLLRELESSATSREMRDRG